MSDLFLKLLNMSISASWLVLAVLVLRMVLKKAPKWVNVLLWAIVAVRLVCPFSFESVLSLIPSAQTVSPDIMMDPTPQLSTGIDTLNNVVNPIISQSFAPEPSASANPLQILIPVAAIIWLVGAALMLIYTFVSFLLLRRKVRTAVRLRDNLFQSEQVDSPFVLGIIRPRIYLPFRLNGQDFEHVVAHEQAHIRRKDHWWKPLGFLLLTLHWFNPLMWLAYILLCRDIELACDEKVIGKLDNESKADYTQALVSCSVSRRSIAACPLAFGEVGVKERVKAVMNYKKPGFWIVITAVVICVIVAVCFLTDPKQDTYRLRIVVPAGSTDEIVYQEDFVYSDEEISPNSNRITISLGEGIGDTEVALKPIEVTEENAYERTYITPGMPVKMDVEKGAWFKVGINMQNTTDEDIVVYVEVKGVEVRISDDSSPDESTPAEFTFEAEILEIHDGYFLVKPESGWDAGGADLLEVPMQNMNPSTEPQVGDHLSVTCDGVILETYPARIANVSHILVYQIPDIRLPRMIMADGQLYTDTEMESASKSHGGIIHRAIESTVSAEKIPSADNQANFEPADVCMYHAGSQDGTIEVCIDGTWWIFATEEVWLEVRESGGKLPEQESALALPDGAAALSAGELNTISAWFAWDMDMANYPMSNSFMTCYYHSLDELSLFEVFGPGCGDNQHGQISDAEREALIERNEFFAAGYEVNRINRDSMDEILLQNTGFGLDDRQWKDLEAFTYLEEYDAYYVSYGGTNWGYYRVTEGYRCSDGSLVLVCEEPSPWTESSYSVLTLCPANPGEGFHGYWFVSNLPYDA